MEARRYSVDARRVVHETIEGEAILINLVSGHYYILGGCGAEVWSLLADGHSGEEVVGELQSRYAADSDGVADPVRALIDELVREELLQPAVHDGNGNGNGKTAVAPAAASSGSFEPPELRKFDDLQYFLLVDPIHEVGPAGWPYERRAASEAEDAA
jgi:Coenzyme PQQ synthesis protein D (PqqD)